MPTFDAQNGGLVNWSERRCAGGLAAANVVATIFGIIFLSFFFLSSFWVTYFSPGRGCPRVMKFGMGS